MENNDTLPPSRRSFLQKIFTATVVSAVGPSIVLGKLVPSLSMDGGALVGRYPVDLASYPPLQQVGGSVQVRNIPGMSGFRMVITRLGENEFVAVNASCPHMGCNVNPANGAGILVCPCHDSEFRPDGTFISGPAGANLTRLETFFDGSATLQVEIPNLPTAVASEDATAAFLGEPRLAQGGMTAEVEYGVIRRTSMVMTLVAASGAEVRRVDLGERAPGEYRAVIELASVPSGVYVLVMRTGSGFTQSRKLVVSR